MIFDVNYIKAQQISPQSFVRKPFAYSSLSTSYNKIYNNLPVLGISSNFYCQSLGFFCKQEIKFETATKIPLKIRVGSVDYCDWMEGKKGTAILKPGN